MFSDQRFPRLETTEFARRWSDAREVAGDALVDLTVGNPTEAFPKRNRAVGDMLEQAVREDANRPYDPEPLGRRTPRRAVADYYRRRGLDVGPNRIVLTASTSEAYAWLAKLFTDARGAFAVPTPSYPLFDHLFRLEEVSSTKYRFLFEGAWAPDFDRLEERFDHEPIRAVVDVSPNNPTGHTLDSAEYAAFADLAADQSVPLVVDEVFLDYHHGETPASSVLELAQARSPGSRPLTAVLSGLSKVAGAPGLKLGWIVLDGPPDLVDEARRRLTFVADNYLSVSDPAQAVAPRALETADAFHDRVRQRLRRNLAAADRLLEATAASALPVEAGWYLTLRLPDFLGEADFAIELLESHDTAVRPGFLFDLDLGTHLVVSLLTAPDTFRDGLRRILEALDEKTSG